MNVEEREIVISLRAALEAAERGNEALGYELDEARRSLDKRRAERDALKERCRALQHELQREATEAEAWVTLLRRCVKTWDGWQVGEGSPVGEARAALARLDQREGQR